MMRDWGLGPVPVLPTQALRAARLGCSCRLVAFPSRTGWILLTCLNNDFDIGSTVFTSSDESNAILLSRADLGSGSTLPVPKARDVSGCLERLVAHSGSVHHTLGQNFSL